MMRDPMQDVLKRWKAAFDGHQLDALAGLFTPDALFQGFGPDVLVGREAVRGYYEAVPDDRSADVTLLHAYLIDERTAGGFAAVTISDPAGWSVSVHLSLVLHHHRGSWLIRQYHVSRVGTDQ